MNDLAREVQEQFAAAAARRREAMEGVGLDSELWGRVMAKRYCASCGKGEREVPITTHYVPRGDILYRQCDHCHHEQLDAARHEERGYAAMVRRMG